MSFSRNIVVCHRCPHRQRPCSGPCACNLDTAKRDIILIARDHTCPIGAYPMKGLGDVLAWLFHWTGLRWLRGRFARPCKCTEKHRKLNGLSEWVVERLAAWIFGS